MTLELLELTEIGKTYYDSNAVYSEQYSKLYDELVPGKGASKTVNGELIRAFSRLQYEYFNNGNCNARDYQRHSSLTTDDDDYDDDSNYEVVISYFYNEFLEFIELHIPNAKNELLDIENRILTENCSFTDIEQHCYTKLGDKVMFYVLNNEDKPL